MRRVAVGLVVVLGCADPPVAPPDEPVGVGAPLAGLDAEAQGRFQRGRTEFLEVEEEGSGLGPLFNARGCAECHLAPTVGGHGTATVVRAGLLRADGTFVEPIGGSLMFAFSIRPDVVRSEIPADANVIARRITPALFGLGLIDAIPDAAIEAQAARTDVPSSVGGRVARVTTSAGLARVGRFGSKAARATVFDFCGDAYHNELGITNEVEARENAPGGAEALVASIDRLADPEAPAGVVGRLADFVTLLAPVAPADPDATADGRAIFEDLGCADCHLPSYRTAADAPFGLADRDVPLYSDLLLHDIGTGDDIGQADAGPREQRTTPLWGLRLRRQLLHDGSALGVAAAIDAHRGQASASRLDFGRLDSNDRAALLAFLAQL